MHRRAFIMNEINRDKFKKVWKLKLHVIWKILKSKKFALLDIDQFAKEQFHIHSYFSKGFTDAQIRDILNVAQAVQTETIIGEHFDSIAIEAKQIINS